MKEVEIAGPLIMISLLPLAVKYGALVGPHVAKIVTAGPAFLLQEPGNLFTIIVALPLSPAARNEARGCWSHSKHLP